MKIYRMVSFPMTLSDCWTEFQGHGACQIDYLKNSAFCRLDKDTIGD